MNCIDCGIEKIKGLVQGRCQRCYNRALYNGIISVKTYVIKESNCLDCHKLFGDEVVYKGRNLCQNCYNKSVYIPKEKKIKYNGLNFKDCNNENKSDSCLECNRLFGDEKVTKNLCITCYSRLLRKYRRQNNKEDIENELIEKEKRLLKLEINKFVNRIINKNYNMNLLDINRLMYLFELKYGIRKLLKLKGSVDNQIKRMWKGLLKR
jgi:hypothetical protein